LFVGREDELRVFSEAAAGIPGAPSVLFLHGPGGVGKSTLLRRMADLAAEAGRGAVLVDARDVDCTPGGFQAAAAPALEVSAPVLLVDSFEQCHGLQGWFRDMFLPRLPAGAVVVVAGREAPQARWRTDPGWQDALWVHALHGLPDDQARQLLRVRGVAPGLEDDLLRFAGGYPLALMLAAEVAVRDEAWATGWTPTGSDHGDEILRPLLAQLVDDVPTRVHLRALEVCAHALTTTESLLQVTLPDADAAELFDWLRRLPYVESGRRGLFPHDVVREALIADLRWRDTEGYLSMHLRMRAHFIDKVATAPHGIAVRYAAELSFLHRAGVMPEYMTWRGEDEVYEDGYRPHDREAVLRLAAEAEGEESARIAAYWLDRQPAAFFVHRSAPTGEVRAFTAWLRVAVSEQDRAADPVVAAAHQHCERVAPLREGEQLAIARFFVDPACYQLPSPVTDLVLWRFSAEMIRTDGIAASYLVLADAGYWAPLMQHCGLSLSRTVAAGRNGHSALFGHDWRLRPLRAWLEASAERERRELRVIVPPEPGRLAVLTREEFAESVRDALRGWAFRDELRANKLIAGSLVARADDPVQALRDVVVEAVDALRDNPRTIKQQRVLAATFFHGRRTQEAAAARLDMPFSTYRRYLTRGVDNVVDHLWRQEIGAARTDGARPSVDVSFGSG
jgi:energy-coupling factor transporter ATP-binding protein EcfA2